MGKQLVTIDNLDEYICQETGKLCAANVIFTPGAKDELNKRGIQIDYESCSENNNSTGITMSSIENMAPDVEKLFYNVAAILQGDFGVKDPQRLCELSARAVKVIKNNI